MAEEEDDEVAEVVVFSIEVLTVSLYTELVVFDSVYPERVIVLCAAYVARAFVGISVKYAAKLVDSRISVLVLEFDDEDAVTGTMCSRTSSRASLGSRIVKSLNLVE